MQSVATQDLCPWIASAVLCCALLHSTAVCLGHRRQFFLTYQGRMQIYSLGTAWTENQLYCLLRWMCCCLYYTIPAFTCEVESGIQWLVLCLLDHSVPAIHKDFICSGRCAAVQLNRRPLSDGCTNIQPSWNWETIYTGTQKQHSTLNRKGVSSFPKHKSTHCSTSLSGSFTMCHSSFSQSNSNLALIFLWIPMVL